MNFLFSGTMYIKSQFSLASVAYRVEEKKMILIDEARTGDITGRL